MKLDEAIEIVKEFEPGMAIPYGQKTKDAIQILIGAGKREKYHRLYRRVQVRGLLPGETEE